MWQLLLLQGNKNAKYFLAASGKPRCRRPSWWLNRECFCILSQEGHKLGLANSKIGAHKWNCVQEPEGCARKKWAQRKDPDWDEEVKNRNKTEMKEFKLIVRRLELTLYAWKTDSIKTECQQQLLQIYRFPLHYCQSQSLVKVKPSIF